MKYLESSEGNQWNKEFFDTYAGEVFILDYITDDGYVEGTFFCDSTHLGGHKETIELIVINTPIDILPRDKEFEI